MENNFHLSNKKAIYYNMKTYYDAIGQDWFKVLPLQFHIKEGPSDKEYLKFVDVFVNEMGPYSYLDKLGKTIWIVKPGENTNRGCGIQVCKDLPQIRDIISNTNVNGQKRSYII
jgi:tubulin--tyrosine ligase